MSNGARDARFSGSLRNWVYIGMEVGGSRQPCLGTEGLKSYVGCSLWQDLRT